MTIAPAGPARADEFARVHALCFAAPWSAASFHGSLLSLGAIGLIAEEGGRAVGIVLASAAGDEAEILTLAVDPEARRRGLGRRLVQAAEGAARARGAHALLLDVAQDNDAARALYAELGYQPVGRRAGYYAAGRAAPVDSLTLRRALVP